MWAMKDIYINTLNSLSEEEQVELWRDLDKYRDYNNSISLHDAVEIFWAY